MSFTIGRHREASHPVSLPEIAALGGMSDAWHDSLEAVPRAEWNALLSESGFAIETLPMSEGTPFANMLWVARRVD